LLDEATLAGCLTEARGALERATIVARGPKPVFALRQYELKPTHVAPEPNTTKELLETLAGISVAGKRVLVLSAGEPFAEPVTSLRTRGAHPEALQLYRWTLTPPDAVRLGETIRELIDGRVDAALFTTQVQVRHLFDVAARIGETERLANALRHSVVVGAVGPTCAAALRERDIEPDVVPDHPKMGHLVVALAKELAHRRSAIIDRQAPDIVDYVHTILSGLGTL
jgi:uroporphyrinogen-III synthase